MDLRLTEINIADLKHNTNNSRTHSQAQIEQIMASIREFGFTNPVLIDEKNKVIAGHGRLEAAEQLGINKIPCIALKNLTDAQKRAYVIADNQIALNSGWDFSKLKEELLSLKGMDFDLSTVGFRDDELDVLLRTNQEFDADSEWVGMPDYDNQDKTAFRSLIVHFKDNGAVQEFCEVTNQRLSDKTKYIWFPVIEIESEVNKKYING
jgi:ParB family transcriptional regulator, chromosome partitioning protein